jgi:GDP-6-deoxy-D-talose 4-dehydrogenase
VDAPSKRVLITGARGFTGVHLRRELEAAGYTVAGLTNVEPTQADEYFADLRDAAAVHDVVQRAAPDLVVHLAAISFVGHGNVDELYEINVLGTLHLLRALAELPVPPQRVVLASSANIYGDLDVDVIDETSPAAPVNHYAATKVAMEAVAAVFRAQLPITVNRPFNYTGPGQTTNFLVPKIVSHFARRAPRIELGNLDVARDFLDVRTVASLYRRILECDAAASTVVNLCSGIGLELREIVAQLERITGHSIAIDVNPAFVRKNEIRRLVGSTARLRALVGTVPAISFEQTLRDMLATP